MKIPLKLNFPKVRAVEKITMKRILNFRKRILNFSALDGIT